MTDQTKDDERWDVLRTLEDWLDGPVIWLGFVWLLLLVVELIWGLNLFLQTLLYIIWGVFIVDFIIRFLLAPKKITFLRHNWLTAISLAVPALRVFAIFRSFRLLSVLRSLRGASLLRIISSINRSMKSLRVYLGRRLFGYVVGLATLVTFAGAAGMWSLENDSIVKGGFHTFADALWWTSMIIITIGSGYWPQTAEGRVLAFLLGVFSFSIFGYITASLATYFIGKEAENKDSDVAGAGQIIVLENKIDLLLAEIENLKSQSNRTGEAPDG